MALNEDQLSSQIKHLTGNNQFVTCQIGDEMYGIDILLVQEIIRYSKPTKIYNANPIVEGVINFRGKIIPLVDMRGKFHMPRVDYDAYTIVIIIEHQRKTIGVIVDRVSDIVTFKEQDIQHVDQEFAEEVKTEHIKGIGKSGTQIVFLFDSDQLIAM